MPVGSYQDPPFTSWKRPGQSLRVAQVCVCVCHLIRTLISLSSTTWMGGCFPLLEPVNRATAAREFRVFHAALHSLNSTYRDSVSGTHRNTCWKWKEKKTPLRSFFSCSFCTAGEQKKKKKNQKIEISEEPHQAVFFLCLWSYTHLLQVYKMLTNKESLDQIIVATPGLRSDPVALGETSQTLINTSNTLSLTSRYVSLSCLTFVSFQGSCRTKTSSSSSQTPTCWTCECDLSVVSTTPQLPVES